MLVRPDAHVAWRSAAMVDDPVAELGRVMESLLGVLEPVGGESDETGIGGAGQRRRVPTRRRTWSWSAAEAAGLPAALFARWLGDEVILLEKAPELGGTASKAAFWYWIPNNRSMQEAGIADPEEDFLRYTARLSRPQHYDPVESRRWG